jgi:hypothetical protein
MTKSLLGLSIQACFCIELPMIDGLVIKIGMISESIGSEAAPQQGAYCFLLPDFYDNSCCMTKWATVL